MAKRFTIIHDSVYLTCSEKLTGSQLSPPHGCVFRRCLKVPSVSDAVTLDGKVFQTRGAATKNVRSPIVVQHEDGVT